MSFEINENSMTSMIWEDLKKASSKARISFRYYNELKIALSEVILDPIKILKIPFFTYTSINRKLPPKNKHCHSKLPILIFFEFFKKFFSTTLYILHLDNKKNLFKFYSNDLDLRINRF